MIRSKTILILVGALLLTERLCAFRNSHSSRRLRHSHIGNARLSPMSEE